MIGDQCQVGLVTPAVGGGMAPALKPTRFASSAPRILDELDVRCPHNHKHQHLVGGRARAAAEYPDGLCEAICRGLVKQKREDASGCTGM